MCLRQPSEEFVAESRERGGGEEERRARERRREREKKGRRRERGGEGGSGVGVEVLKVALEASGTCEECAACGESVDEVVSEQGVCS